MSHDITKNSKISRYELSMFVNCARCFWLLKRHGVKQPEGYPYALNNAMDTLLKAHFDECRSHGELPLILKEHNISARLFHDTEKLRKWRNNREGLRWDDPETGYTFFGAIDDILEYPDGSLAIIDYKASGAKEATVYPDYQFQIDVYTFLLQKAGYKTAPKAYFVFFMAVKDQAFQGHLPFQRVVKEVTPLPERVYSIFKQSIELIQATSSPERGEKCEQCRWFDETYTVLNP